MKIFLLITFSIFIFGCDSNIEVVEKLEVELENKENVEEKDKAAEEVVASGCNNDFSGNTITPNFNKIHAGGEHTCFLTDAGTVKCWGKNNQGQLGVGHEDDVGSNDTSNTFQTVALGVSVSSISAGSYHNCGIVDTGVDTGKVRCWGEAGNGRSGHMTHANGLGDNIDIGDNELPSVFDASDFGVNVKKVIANGLSSCVLLVDGNVRCWGSGSNGGTGNGNTLNQRYYEDAVNMDLNLGVETVTDIVGMGNKNCILTSAGNVKCWGSGYKGMLGYGNTDNIGDDETTAALANISIGGVATQIEVSNTTTCALFNNGKARCWGRNSEGQLGLGHINDIGDDELPSSEPFINVTGTIVQISPANHHTCALLSTGNVTCWGNGSSGQKGDLNLEKTGDDEDISNVHVKLCEPAVGISSGYHHTCALLESGKVTCWGSNGDGRLGYGHENKVGDDEHPSDEIALELE